MINESRFDYLLDRVHRNTATIAEFEELMQQIENDTTGELIEKANRFFAGHTSKVEFSTSPGWWNSAVRRILDTDKEKEATPVRRIKPVIRKYWYAAAVLLLALSTLFLLTRKEKTVSTQQEEIAELVLPGKEGALLTLANGSQVLLDTFRNGVVALQGGVEAKVVNGSLIYQGKGNEVLYNTMSTPKGRIFHVTLPDGTDVWMNAASSIRFPTAFTGNERRVEVSGEVYFEVAGSPKKPFIVTVDKKMEIEVLGTHFNVNAYSNEGMINTTLLEGAVKVSELNNEKQHNTVLLKPGQQARAELNNAAVSDIRVIENADTEIVMAWRQGIFNFDRASLQEVMRQLERWYDIEVKFGNYTSDERFTGRMYRDLPLNELLQQFGKTGVKFDIKGRTVIVSNQ